jgi:hypothetical protein
LILSAEKTPRQQQHDKAAGELAADRFKDFWRD